MLLILIGYLFIALDTLLNFAGMVWEMPPDFVGYLLIAIGAGKFRFENPPFAKVRSFSFMAAGVSGFLYLLRMLSLSYAPPSILITMEVAELVLMVLVIRLLIAGLDEQAKQTGLSFQTKIMKYLWIALIVVLIVAYLGQIFPVVNSVSALAVDLVSLSIFVFFYFAYQTLREAE